MDIMLERILSLIPTKLDGKFVHGEKKKFAENIGLKSGNLIADWINGRSKSYENYLYEISAKYDVSVEWLRGETDEKQKKTTASSDDDLNDEILSLLLKLPEEQRKRELAYLRSLAIGQDK